MEALDVRAVNTRLTLALDLLYATGLRLSEAIAVRAEDLQWVRFAPDAADAETVDGWLLRVVGMGNRACEVPVPYEVTIELADYFASGLARDLEHAGNAEAYLLGKTPRIPIRHRGVRDRAAASIRRRG